MSAALALRAGLAVVAVATGASATDSPRTELGRLIPYAQAFCEPIFGNREAFRQAVLPFAPLSLGVANGSPAERAAARNLFLGMAGQACGVNATALARSFNCGLGCVARRKAELVAKVVRLRALAAEVGKRPGFSILAQWGVPGEFRVDNIFAVRGRVLVVRPSPRMGLVPSDDWTLVSDLAAALKGRGVPEQEVLRLVEAMKAESIAAIVRDGGVLRMVRMGIADNESGLLIASNLRSAPRVGQRTSDGREYRVVEQIEPGVWFYETT